MHKNGTAVMGHDRIVIVTNFDNDIVSRVRSPEPFVDVPRRGDELKCCSPGVSARRTIPLQALWE